MGTQRVQMNGYFLTTLVNPVQNIFPHRDRTLFQCLCPHRQASCAGSRAGSPVSLGMLLNMHGKAEETTFRHFSVSYLAKTDTKITELK
jgi:hypothetical protein